MSSVRGAAVSRGVDAGRVCEPDTDDAVLTGFCGVMAEIR